MWRVGLFLSWLLASSLSWAEEVHSEPAFLPAEVVVQRDEGPVTMQLTGYAKRKLLGKKIYLISSYCENRSGLDTAADVLAFKGQKQLRIRMLRSLPSSLVARMIRRSFNACDREKQLGEEIKRVEEFLRDHQFEIGDEIILTSLGASGLSCRINAFEPIVVEKPALVHVVWSIYFGDPPYFEDYIPRGLTRLIAPGVVAGNESDAGEGTKFLQRASPSPTVR